MRVPPRTARWQATVLAYAQDLRRQTDSHPSGSLSRSLSFAAQSFQKTHPVRQLAEAGVPLPVRSSTFVADEERVRALLARVQMSAALYCQGRCPATLRHQCTHSSTQLLLP